MTLRPAPAFNSKPLVQNPRKRVILDNASRAKKCLPWVPEVCRAGRSLVCLRPASDKGDLKKPSGTQGRKSRTALQGLHVPPSRCNWRQFCCRKNTNSGRDKILIDRSKIGPDEKIFDSQSCLHSVCKAHKPGVY